MIAWLIIIKKTFWRQEPQVMWSRLWSKNSKLTTFSFNVSMLFCPLFSMNCLIPPLVRIWHHLLCWQNCRNTLFSLEPFVVKAIHPCGEYSICCFLLMYDGVAKTNFQWVVDFGLFNIPLWKVQFLPIVFDGDFLFELPPIHLNVHNPSQMQGMDKSTMAMLGVSWSYNQYKKFDLV